MGEKKRKKREGGDTSSSSTFSESEKRGSMADSTNARCQERKSEGQLAENIGDCNKRRQPKVESKLGGTVDVGIKGIGVDANTNRVDRLRLLGNGVVPQTAAKAFSTLSMRLVDHLKP